MIEIKILIIEQQKYLVNLKTDLKDLNMSFVYSKLLKLSLVQETQPDLVLLDISSFDLEEAVSFCEKLNKEKIPFVILTNRYKYESYLDFQHTSPQTFLNRNNNTNVRIGISIAVERLITQFKESKNKSIEKELFFFIKDSNNKKEKILIKDILWIRSDGNYCYLQTEERKYVMRKYLKQVNEKLPPNIFIQIFRGIIVQKEKIDKVDIRQNCVFIKEYSLPLGRKYKQQVMSEFSLSKT